MYNINTTNGPWNMTLLIWLILFHGPSSMESCQLYMHNAQHHWWAVKHDIADMAYILFHGLSSMESCQL